MNQWQQARAKLGRQRHSWLVTGAAGFIGSHLVQCLLELDQKVVGIDNFSTGFRENLNDVARTVGASRWEGFRLIEGDLRSLDACVLAVQGVDYVLHQAAIASVPRSIKEPLENHENNVTASLNLFHAAAAAGVQSAVFASSSAVYGDCREPILKETHSGRMLSPYAVTKKACEQFADVFQRCYKLPVVGLRYFNVFGPRQDPMGAYAAVIPRWIEAILSGSTMEVFGDGETSRDFCSVLDVVQANVLAALGCTAWPDAAVFNVGTGRRTTLNDLLRALKVAANDCGIPVNGRTAFLPERPGDIRSSCADIGKIRSQLGFEASRGLDVGLVETMAWYKARQVPEPVPVLR